MMRWLGLKDLRALSGPNWLKFLCSLVITITAGVIISTITIITTKAHK